LRAIIPAEGMSVDRSINSSEIGSGGHDLVDLMAELGRTDMNRNHRMR
jgi:hypothetical protein